MYIGWISKLDPEMPCSIKVLRILSISLFIAKLLPKAEQAWNTKTNLIPLTVMAAAYLSARKGKDKSETGIAVLRYAVYAAAVCMLAGSIERIDWKGLQPKAKWPGTELLFLLLLPLVITRGRGGNGKTIISTIAITLFAFGTQDRSMYAVSRTLTIKGVADHVESVTACAMTISVFSLLATLLNAAREENKWKYTTEITAILAAILYVSNTVMRTEGYVIIQLVLWGAIPVMCAMKEILQKKEKSA